MSTRPDDSSTVLSDPQPQINADELERVIAEKRRTLADLATDEHGSRRSRALDHLAAYAVMLRETATGSPGGDLRSSEPGVIYTFKVEYEDQSWTIEEKELETTPRVGDVVSFDEGLDLRVRALQLVRPRPSDKPAQTFFICAPSV